MEKDTKAKIIETLSTKFSTKLNVYALALHQFAEMKKQIEEIATSYQQELVQIDPRISITYRDRGDFEAELKVGGDVLIFSLHTNIFQFDSDNFQWKTSYLKDNEQNGFCAVISIYNFIADSLKYNRMEDLGYLIGRIFINRENHFFVEGKRQLGFLYNSFSDSIFDSESQKNIIESAMLYALNFDLFVPKYDDVSITNVSKIEENIEMSLAKTGKRIGFVFSSEADEI
ncbi:MAG: hypothetical protein RIS47_491 [Bacteroidota bacterium]|jgi:hypothetical protein